MATVFPRVKSLFLLFTENTELSVNSLSSIEKILSILLNIKTGDLANQETLEEFYSVNDPFDQLLSLCCLSWILSFQNPSEDVSLTTRFVNFGMKILLSEQQMNQKVDIISERTKLSMYLKIQLFLSVYLKFIFFPFQSCISLQNILPRIS